jgi:hypothetical protein
MSLIRIPWKKFAELAKNNYFSTNLNSPSARQMANSQISKYQERFSLSQRTIHFCQMFEFNFVT